MVTYYYTDVILIVNNLWWYFRDGKRDFASNGFQIIRHQLATTAEKEKAVNQFGRNCYLYLDIPRDCRYKSSASDGSFAF